MSVYETLADILAQLKVISADSTEQKAANEEQKEATGIIWRRKKIMEKKEKKGEFFLNFS